MRGRLTPDYKFLMEGYDLFSSCQLIYDMFTWRVRLERAWSYDSLSRWEREPPQRWDQKSTSGLE
jgi:hypothetical protein